MTKRSTAFHALPLLLLLSGALPVSAEQRIDLDGTAIIGNKEAPNILYVVPWNKAGRLDPLEPLSPHLSDDLRQPLDRATFQRRLELWQGSGENR